MIKSTKALTLASYLSMLFLGIAGAVVGAAARNINLSASQIGLLLAIQNVGFMIAVLVSGALADSLEKPRILLVGSLILAFSFLSFYVTGIFWVNLLIMTLIGVGVGTYEGVTDAMLLDLHSKRQSLHINVNHFFVTLGAILITVYLIFLEMNWRISLVQSAAVVFLLAVFYALARLKNKERPAEDYLQRIRILTRERLVVSLFIATIVVVGVEIGSIGILTTFLMDLRGFTQTTSKIGLLIFLAGIATGRLVIGLLTRRGQLSQYILGMFGFASLVFVSLYFLDLGQLIYASSFAAGLALSALLPLMITFAGLHYPHMSGTVIGSIKVAIPVGGILLPFLLSTLTRIASFQAALAVFPLSLLLASTLLYLEFRRIPALELPGA